MTVVTLNDTVTSPFVLPVNRHRWVPTDEELERSRLSNDLWYEKYWRPDIAVIERSIVENGVKAFGRWIPLVDLEALRKLASLIGEHNRRTMLDLLMKHNPWMEDQRLKDTLFGLVLLQTGFNHHTELMRHVIKVSPDGCRSVALTGRKLGHIDLADILDKIVKDR